MAEFVTSREDLSTKLTARRNPDSWWNLWQTRRWPYRELIVGDTLYWYDSTARSIVSQSTVTGVKRFRYHDKVELFEQLGQFFGSVDTADAYTASKPDNGYCLAFKVQQEATLNIRKPEKQKFPRDGWLHLTEDVRAIWFEELKAPRPPESEVSLDTYVDDGDLLSQLRDIDKAMQEVSPERRNEIVCRSIRKDSKIVRALKAAANYRCQFSACDAQIKKRSIRVSRG